jgi:hypothetical protein
MQHLGYTGIAENLNFTVLRFQTPLAGGVFYFSNFSRIDFNSSLIARSWLLTHIVHMPAITTRMQKFSIKLWLMRHLSLR